MKKLLIFVLVSALLVAGISAFGQEFANIFPPVPNVKYGGTLKYVLPDGPMTFNLNPFLPAGVNLTIVQEIYEPLFYINILNGNTTPILGTAYKWADNNLELIVTVRQGVKWSDGTPFTAKDVAFTFNYMKKYPALDTYGMWSSISDLQSVEASGDTVVFKFSQPNTPIFYYINQVLIVPESLWSNITDPSKYTNSNPVGTGPFIFKTFNAPYQIIAVKNPNYWMKGRPYIDKVVIESVSSDTTALMYVLKHTYDGTYDFIPDPQKTWIDPDPNLNHMYWPVTNLYFLYLNTQKAPFDNPTFRRAISVSIDRNMLEKAAFFGTGGYDQNPTGIIPAQQPEWMDPTLTAEASALNAYNPTEAQELLASIGFKKDAAGNLVGPNGKALPTYKILVGAGWTDMITMAEIISQELKVLGINTTIDQETYSTYMSSLMTGTYDTAICWGSGSGPQPYYLYYQEFNPIFSASKIGEVALSDYGRYTNPLITAALDVYASTSNLLLQKQAMYTIERIVLSDVPFVVLTNRTQFLDYTTANLSGWPSYSNPYTSGGNMGTPDGLPTVLNVHLK